jgi:hypothetical protein
MALLTKICSGDPVVDLECESLEERRMRGLFYKSH